MPGLRIVYAFTGGRRERLQQIEAGVEAPSEFLYGLPQLRRSGYAVDLVEADYSSTQAGWMDDVLNRLSARLVGIGVNAPAYAAHVPRLASCDALIATPDSTALAFARLKATRRAPDVPLVYFAMGLAAALDRVQRRRPLVHRAFRALYAGLVAQCSAVAALGEGEYEMLRTLFPASAERIHFVPFGIDTGFWRPAGEAPRDDAFLFVGNDTNRDFELVRDIVQQRPDLRFRVVTSNPALLRLHAPNVEAYEGDWRRAALSDDEMRQMYRRCLAVILPLRESRQPSGQSVALQAIACGTPVLITRTEGFWEPARWGHREHVYFVDGHSVSAWSAALDAVREDEVLRGRLSREGAALVRARYSVELFAERTAALVEQVVASR